MTEYNLNILEEKINKALINGLILKDLTCIPINGLINEEISNIEEKIEYSLPNQYKEFLKKYNGADFDVVRIFGNDISNFQVIDYSLLVFSSDPSGFLYAFDKNEKVYCIDPDGGEIILVAQDFGLFLCDYIFGKDSKEFGEKE
jgi:hypothetical protein